MDDGAPEATNYDGLMQEGGEGRTPGEIPAGSREAVMVASTPVRRSQARVTTVDLVGDVSGNEQAPFNAEKVIREMAQIQAETGSHTAECLQKAATCITDLTKALQEKTKSEKRGRDDGVEDKLKADSPVTIDFKKLQMASGLDDAHSKLCWEVRRNWRSINADPEDYWKDEGEEKGWPRKIEPNLAGQVFLDHMIPHMICEKALYWMHDVSKPLEVRHFLHSNSKSRSKKNRRTEIQTREAEGGDGSMHIESYVTWNEAGSVKEMVESVLNYAAVVFMVRPWDFSGIVLLRCLHEVNFFALTSRTAKEQRDLVSEFVEDVFLANSRAMAKGKHPLTLKEALELAGKHVSKKNGMGQHLVSQCDAYGMHRELKEKDDEIKKLKTEVTRLKSQLNEEKQKRKGGYDEYQKRINGRPIDEGRRREGGGGGEGRFPPGFVEARKKTCLFYNKGDCRQGSACTRGDHACSQVVGQKMCGSTDHSRPEHK